MRISDWSSDVCSSDLLFLRWQREHRSRKGQNLHAWRRLHPDLPAWSQSFGGLVQDRYSQRGRPDPTRRCAYELLHYRSNARSEEHTSELQSLMRRSYAVFCLKKKKTHTTTGITKYTYTYIST